MAISWNHTICMTDTTAIKERGHTVDFVKGGSVTILSISLFSQNIYLCRGKSENNGPFLLAITILVC